jgi:hypothetical protein
MPRLPVAQTAIANLWIYPLNGRIIELGKTKIHGQTRPRGDDIKWLSKNLIKLI